MVLNDSMRESPFLLCGILICDQQNSSLFCLCFCLSAEIQSCLVSSGDVGCGTFQCFSNNSCEIQGLHHICLTLLHNAGRYDSQVGSRATVWPLFTHLSLHPSALTASVKPCPTAAKHRLRSDTFGYVYISSNPCSYCSYFKGAV